MKYLQVICTLLLVGCAYGVSTTDTADAGSDTLQSKSCHPSDAQYQVTFKLLSGNCPNIDDKVSYQWVSSSGQMNVLSNCQDHSVYDPCTSFIDLYCTTWVYKEELMGQLNWTADGSQATGELTFTAFELDNNYLFCSSVYETTYVRQWEAAGP